MRKTGRKKIGLALGSGGFRGLAHIGVIKVLEKNGIPIDYIAGSSAGSIVGGIYSAHRDIQKVEEIVNTLNLKELIGAFSDPYFKEGIFKGEQLMRTIKKYIGDFQIEETQIPFKAVATEMRSGKMIVIDKGNLAEAATASSSMPIVFKPFSDKATSLVDGGISCQVPAKIVRDMGADIVIAVNLMDNIAPDYYRNRISFVQHYILLLFHSLAQENIKEADIVLSPTFRTESWLEHMKNPQTLINEGERVTTLALSRIRPLINPQNY